MGQRITVLEPRVQQLEHLVADLLDKLTTLKRQSRAKARERTTWPLPKQFVSLLAFARWHNIAESTAQTHMGIGLFPVERGTWMDIDETEVKEALNAKGREVFYHLYQGFPQFMKCPRCSHGYQHSVVQTRLKER